MIVDVESGNILPAFIVLLSANASFELSQQHSDNLAVLPSVTSKEVGQLVQKGRSTAQVHTTRLSVNCERLLHSGQTRKPTIH